MMDRVIGIAKRTSLFAFNRIHRDLWVARQAQKILPGQKVLDLGAGTCPYSSLFKHCDYKTADFKQLPKEQLMGRAGYGEIDYVCDVTSVPVPDESFDIVLCTEVLEHIPEPILVLKEISRILKPGGLLILTAPLASGLHQEPYHFYGGFSPYWHKKYLSGFGFSEVVIESNGGFFLFYSQESLRFMKMAAPWTLRTSIMYRILWFPVWLAAAPLLAVAVPLFCRLMDRTDETKQFTVGYHITARKEATGGRATGKSALTG